jgi:hypothetical protein
MAVENVHSEQHRKAFPLVNGIFAAQQETTFFMRSLFCIDMQMLNKAQHPLVALLYQSPLRTTLLVGFLAHNYGVSA